MTVRRISHLLPPQGIDVANSYGDTLADFLSRESLILVASKAEAERKTPRQEEVIECDTLSALMRIIEQLLPNATYQGPG